MRNFSVPCAIWTFLTIYLSTTAADGLDITNLTSSDLNNYTISFNKDVHLYIREVEGKITRELFDKSLLYLSISESNITEVEDGAFCANGQPHDINIYLNKHFPDITNEMYENCTQLTDIALGNVTIRNTNFLEKLDQLEHLSLFSVYFSNDTEMSAKNLKGPEIAGLSLWGVRPRKYENDAFTLLPKLRYLTIGGYSIDESPELSENTLKYLENAASLNLMNVNLTSIQWHRMKHLRALELDGPHSYEENRQFFENLRHFFPILEKIVLNRKYFTENETEFAENLTEEYNVTIKWQTKSNT